MPSLLCSRSWSWSFWLGMEGVLAAGSGLGGIALDRQATHALERSLAARQEQRDHDADEGDEEDHERDLGVAGETRAAHDVGEALHGALRATCCGLMSRPSRWRYATSATICLS